MRKETQLRPARGRGQGSWLMGAVLLLKVVALAALLWLELWKLFYFYPEQKRERQQHSQQMEQLERQLK